MKQKAAAGNQAKQPKSDKAVKSANGHTDNGKTPARKKIKPSPKDLPALGDDFAVLDLPRPLNHAIQTLGFETCTPVQKSVLPHSLDGADIIAQAQTGTGKRPRSWCRSLLSTLKILKSDLEHPAFLLG